MIFFADSVLVWAFITGSIILFVTSFALVAKGIVVVFLFDYKEICHA